METTEGGRGKGEGGRGGGYRFICVKHWSRTPADPGSIPGAGDKNKRLISLPCNIRRCAPRGSHMGDSQGNLHFDDFFYNIIH